jgi:hypothetical protein
MDTDKFKSIALNTSTYNKIREMADKCFSMPISMAKANEYLITKAYQDWIDNGKHQTEYIPHPNLKYFLPNEEFIDKRIRAVKEKPKSLFSKLFKK